MAIYFANIILLGNLGYLVVPDHCNVCLAIAWTSIVNHMVMFGAWDSTGGEQLRKQLHTQRVSAHVLRRQPPTGGAREESRRKIKREGVTLS